MDQKDWLAEHDPPPPPVWTPEDQREWEAWLQTWQPQQTTPDEELPY